MKKSFFFFLGIIHFWYIRIIQMMMCKRKLKNSKIMNRFVKMKIKNDGFTRSKRLLKVIEAGQINLCRSFQANETYVLYSHGVVVPFPVLIDCVNEWTKGNSKLGSSIHSIVSEFCGIFPSSFFFFFFYLPCMCVYVQLVYKAICIDLKYLENSFIFLGILFFGPYFALYSISFSHRQYNNFPFGLFFFFFSFMLSFSHTHQHTFVSPFKCFDTN